ncbi:MAG: MFS transporter [Planctomycetota bacterium]|nr:MFS transporter [Planctomycetota bacterium]
MKWRALTLLVLAEMAVMALWFSASAVVPQLAEEWELTGSEKAMLTVSVQLGFVAGALVSAIWNLSDRISSRVLFGLCGLAGALLNALIPFGGVGPQGTIVLRFLIGATLAGVYPPGMKLAASWSLCDRGLAIGLLVGALTLGSALPHLFNAVPLLGEGGMPPWRSVLLASSVVAAAGAVIVPLFVRQGPHVAPPAPFDWRYAAKIFTSRPVRLANLGYLGHMWELYAMWTWTPLLLVASYEQAGRSLSHARLAGFATVAVGALGCVLAGLAADRIGRTTVTIASLVVSGTCCLVAGLFFDSPGVLTAVCLVWGFAVVADSAQFSAAITELSDPRYVGTSLTVQVSLGFLLSVATIQLVPFLVEAVGWSYVFPVLAFGPFVGVIAMLRLRRLPEATRMASGRR